MILDLHTMSMKQHATEIIARKGELMADMKANGFKSALTNAFGGMSISKLGVEAIGILVLVIIFILCPVIGDAVFSAMPEVNTTTWGDVTGPELWSTLSPMIQVTAIVLIAALVIKAIYDFRQGAE